MADFVVNFFLEDSAQEAFIPHLFKRLVCEKGLDAEKFELRLLSDRGGVSIQSYKNFVKEAKRSTHLNADVLVVGSDGNCKGFQQKRTQITRVVAKPPFSTVFTAIPDPHIERWYLIDPSALSKVLEGAQVELPKHKCEKNYYKTLLMETFSQCGVLPPLGGIEYGPEIAHIMDIYSASKLDHGFKDFVDQVQAWLEHLKRR